MPSKQEDGLKNLPLSVIKLHDDRELMRLASLVGTDANIPELKLARYIDKLITKDCNKRVREAREDQIMQDFLTYANELDDDESLLIDIRDEQLAILKKED